MFCCTKKQAHGRYQTSLFLFELLILGMPFVIFKNDNLLYIPYTINLFIFLSILLTISIRLSDISLIEVDEEIIISETWPIVCV